MLMQLTTENRAIQIQQYGEEAISAFPVEWTSFYQDLTQQMEYIVLDTFYTTKIAVFGATQFEKIGTQS